MAPVDASPEAAAIVAAHDVLKSYFPASAATLDAQRVDWTRRQLRKLLQEIVVLAKGELPPERFFPEFLSRATEVLAATSGAVWSINSAGKLLLAHQVEFPKESLAANRDAALRHERLLRHVADNGSPVAVLPKSELPGVAGASNPTEMLLLAIPLVNGGRIDGVYLALLPLTAIASFEAVQPLGTALQQLEANQVAARRLFGIADAPPPVAGPALPLPPPSDCPNAVATTTTAAPAG